MISPLHNRTGINAGIIQSAGPGVRRYSSLNPGFGFTHGEEVLALSYEDMNCITAGDHDRTAYAILSGVAAYLGLDRLQILFILGGLALALISVKIYPNPFHPTTTIEFFVPERADITMDVFDILGRKVASLLSEELQPGRYQVVMHSTDMTSGVYFYALSAVSTSGRRFFAAKRFLLTK